MCRHESKWEELWWAVGFPRDSVIKNPPAMQESQVLSLGWEDPQKESMATHSRILAWEIPWIEELGRLQSTGSQRVRHNWSDLAQMHAWPATQWRISEMGSSLWKDHKPWSWGSETSSLGCARSRKTSPDIQVALPMRPQRAVALSPHITLSILLDVVTQESGAAYYSPSLAFIKAATSSSASGRVITDVIENISVFWFWLFQQVPGCPWAGPHLFTPQGPDL